MQKIIILSNKLHEKRQFLHFAFRRGPHICFDPNNALCSNPMNLLKAGGIAAIPRLFPRAIGSITAPSFSLV
jgi:hypothetical protein